AMVTGRRWTVEEFESYLVRHPLLFYLVTRLLWGVYDSAGKLTQPFLISAGGDYLDQRDKTVKLKKGATVGIVHPLHLPEPGRSTWAQLFSLPTRTPPFSQLDRPVYPLLAAEEDKPILTRFKKAEVSSSTLKSSLEKAGWVRGDGSDHGH